MTAAVVVLADPAGGDDATGRVFNGWRRRATSPAVATR